MRELPSTSTTTPPPAAAAKTGMVVLTPRATAAALTLGELAGARAGDRGDQAALLRQRWTTG